jgi:hypothetical protein
MKTLKTFEMYSAEDIEIGNQNNVLLHDWHKKIPQTIELIKNGVTVTLDLRDTMANTNRISLSYENVEEENKHIYQGSFANNIVVDIGFSKYSKDYTDPLATEIQYFFAIYAGNSEMINLKLRKNEIIEMVPPQITLGKKTKADFVRLIKKMSKNQVKISDKYFNSKN